MVIQEETKAGLSSKIANSVIDNLMEMKKKSKKEKSPLKIRLSKAQLKKNYAVALLLHENGSIDIKKVKIEDESFYLPETKGYYMGSADYMWNYKKFPVLITPTWSVEPVKKPEEFAINKSILAEESKKNGTNISAQKFLILKAEMIAAGLKPKKGGSKIIMIIIIIAVVIAVLYMVISGQKIF